MPFDIDLKHAGPVGLVSKNAVRDTLTEARITGFCSSEDGDDLVAHLDGISAWLLDRLPRHQRPRESVIDHLLAIIRRNGKATVYVNELQPKATIRAKRSAQAGEALQKDDIADIHEVEFTGVDIPGDAGFLVMISVGWRKGLYWDFLPLLPDNPTRSMDTKAVLAQVYAYLSFQERFRITEEQWAELLRQGWFPFIGHTTDELRSILVHASQKAPIDALLDDMAPKARARSKQIRELVANHSALQAHRRTLTTALQHFENGDDLSCTAMLFPRIEGILRKRNEDMDGGGTGQSKLASAASADPTGSRHPMSLLLPERFRVFLEEVYFAHFDPADIRSVSRHTVAHGVAPEDRISFKSALMGMMILEQVIRLMPPSSPAQPEARSGPSSDA